MSRFWWLPKDLKGPQASSDTWGSARSPKSLQISGRDVVGIQVWPRMENAIVLPVTQSNESQMGKRYVWKNTTQTLWASLDIIQLTLGWKAGIPHCQEIWPSPSGTFHPRKQKLVCNESELREDTVIKGKILQALIGHQAHIATWTGHRIGCWDPQCWIIPKARRVPFPIHAPESG